MTTETLRQLIVDLQESLDRMLLSDSMFGTRLASILANFAVLHGEAIITITDRKTGDLVGSYGIAEDRADRSTDADARTLSDDSWSVACVLRHFLPASPRTSAGESDEFIRKIGALVQSHWGNRDSGTLLPSLKAPGNEARFITSFRESWDETACSAILHADLDKFKDVNTEFGEPVGDAVLREFARRFRDAFHDLGILVRTGGEEFSAMLLTDTAGAALRQIASFRSLMENSAFDPIGRANTCSVGVAIHDRVARPAFASVDQILDGARAFGKRAKSDGRNRIRLRYVDPSVEIALDRRDLQLLTLKARVNINQPATMFATPFANTAADLVADALAGAMWNEVDSRLERFADNYGLVWRDRAAPPSNDVPIAAEISIVDWVAAVARALLTDTRCQAVPDDGCVDLVLNADGRLYLQLTGASGVQRTRVPAPVIVGLAETVELGRRWSTSTTASSAALVRVDRPSERPAGWFSPCLMLPIGDAASDAAKSFSGLVAATVEIDERPVLGGGLPDFWQSNLARIVGACLANPNIQTIVVTGNAANALNTLLRLRAPLGTSHHTLDDLQRQLSIPTEALKLFNARSLSIVEATVDEASIAEALCNATAHATSTAVQGRNTLDLGADSARRRRLKLGTPTDAGRLSLHDGLRTRTLADAYPLAIQLIRASDEAETQVETTGRSFREFPSFKLVLTNPLSDAIPDYWASEETQIERYVEDNFRGSQSLFGSRLEHVRAGQNESLRELARKSTIEALRDTKPTRRIVLPVLSIQDDPTQPLGLFGIHMLPRFRDQSWHLDFIWIWRTVEALVGFPFSAFGSIRWSDQFHREVRRALAGTPQAAVEFGNLTYIALSFHIFLDRGDQEIARAIVQDATR